MTLKDETRPEEVTQLIQRGLSLLKRVNQHAESVHVRQQYPGLSREDTFLLAYKVRMLRQSQAVETLVEANLFDPASSILRVLLEQGFVLSAISDNKQHLQDLFKQDGAEVAKALKGLRFKLQEAERAPGLTDTRLDDEIAKLPKGTGFSAHNWAGLAGMESTYATLYRTVSLFSHGGAGPTAEYLEFDSGSMPHVKPHITALKVPDLLLNAAALTLDSTVTLRLSEPCSEASAMYPILQAELYEFADMVHSMSVTEVN